MLPSERALRQVSSSWIGSTDLESYPLQGYLSRRGCRSQSRNPRNRLPAGCALTQGCQRRVCLQHLPAEANNFSPKRQDHVPDLLPGPSGNRLLHRGFELSHRASPLRGWDSGTDEGSLLRRVSRHEADDGEPERPKTVVDPTGIPETVCPPIEHDPQTAVTPEDASQLGVSGGFVSRDHHEPPDDGPTPAPSPLSRWWHRGSRHSPSPHSGALDRCRYSSVMVPSSFSTTR